MKQFLGLVGYYQKFVPRFADISRVLTHLTKKDVEFKWTAECENCFQIPKKIPKKSPPELHTLHRCLKLCLCRHTDTTLRWHRSSHNLCTWTILWITIKLGDTHQRSFAIYKSVKKLSFYIDTAKIRVKSNHFPLKKFLEKNTLNSKVNNWAVELESQNITFEYIPEFEILWQILCQDL